MNKLNNYKTPSQVKVSVVDIKNEITVNPSCFNYHKYIEENLLSVSGSTLKI